MVDSIKNNFSRVDPHQKGRTADVSAAVSYTHLTLPTILRV